MKKAAIVIIGLLLMLAASACTVDWGNGNVSFNPDFHVSAGNGKLSTVEKIKTSETAGANKLIVRNTAGTVPILKGDTDRLEIRTTIKVTSEDEEAKKAVMDNILIAESHESSGIILEPKTVDKGEDPWKWARAKYGIMNLTIDMEIKAPAGIDRFVLRETAGDLKLQGLQGNVSIDLITGNITLEDVVLKGRNTFSFNAGNADFRGSVDNAGSLEITGIAGNISVKMPSEQKFDLDSGITAGNIGGSFLKSEKHGSGNIRESVNGGGAELKFKVTTGNIEVNRF